MAGRRSSTAGRVALVTAWMAISPTEAPAIPAAPASFLAHGCVSWEGSAAAETTARILPPWPPFSDPAPLGGSASALSAKVDNEGCFSLPVPAPGLWTVRLTAHGYVPLELEGWPLLEEVDLPAATLVVAEPLRVEVRGRGSRGLAGARVWGGPRRSGPRETWRPAWRSATTDANGRAMVGRAPGEQLSVLVLAPGHLPTLTEPGLESRWVVRPAEGKNREVQALLAPDRPAGGAQIRQGSGFLPAGTTRDDGTLTLALPSDSSTPLHLSTLDGFVALGEAAPTATGPHSWVLQPAPRVRGRVLDQKTGSPLPGALVWLDRQPWSQTRSAADGGFSLPLTVPSPSPPVVHAIAAGFLPDRAGAPSGPGGATSEVILSLVPATVLRGSVIDGAGRPVAQAQVRLETFDDGESLTGMPLEKVSLAVLSRARGAFTLGPLPLGRSWRLSVSAPGFAPFSVSFTHYLGGGSVPVVLGRGARAFGRVLDHHGRPVSGARVTLRMWGREDASLETASGAEGKFTFARLSAGTYDLQASAPGQGRAGRAGLTVIGDGGVDLGDLTLPEGVDLIVRTVDSLSNPVAGARVSVSAEAAEADPGAVFPPAGRTDEKGETAIRGLLEGDKLELTVEAEGWSPARRTGLTLPRDEPVVVVLDREARILGRVVDSTGQGIAAWVQIEETRAELPLKDGIAPAWRSRRNLRTDAEGRFELPVQPGRVVLGGHAEGFQPAAPQTLEIAPGSRLDGVLLTLEEGAALAGRVSRGDGRPVAGVKVRLREPETAGGFSETAITFTDEDGHFRIEGAPPRRQLVEALEVGGALARRELVVEPGENWLDLVLDPGRRITGKVIDATGSPVAEARVTIRPDGGFQGAALTIPTDAGGGFAFEGIPPGRYHLSVERAVGRPAATGKALVVGSDDIEGLEVRLAELGP